MLLNECESMKIWSPPAEIPIPDTQPSVPHTDFPLINDKPGCFGFFFY